MYKRTQCASGGGIEHPTISLNKPATVLYLSFDVVGSMP